MGVVWGDCMPYAAHAASNAVIRPSPPHSHLTPRGSRPHPTPPTRVHGLHTASCVGRIDRRLLEHMLQPFHASHYCSRFAVTGCSPRCLATFPALGGRPPAGPRRCQQADAGGAASLHVPDLCRGVGKVGTLVCSMQFTTASASACKDVINMSSTLSSRDQQRLKRPSIPSPPCRGGSIAS